MAAFTLRARWVVSVDGPPIPGGYITVAEGRITAVDVRPPAGGPVEDLGDMVLMPGLVNAHTHLEFSDLAAPLGCSGMSLPAWIRLVIAERKRGNHDASAAIAAGLAESAAAGVTTLGEISTASAATYAIGGSMPGLIAFQESIGFSAQRVDSAFADLRRRLAEAAAPAGLSPHAPYTVHPRLVEQITALAAAEGISVAMHLAESPDELQLLADGDGDFRTLLEERSMWDATAIPHGSRPMDYLRRLVKAPRALVIHGNYLAADEIALAGERRETMSVVYCPRTQAYFGHPTYPLAAMRKAGVRIALGTDSRASNPDLDLLADLRFAAARFLEIDPAVWIQMATLDAARALGVGDAVGSLFPGKRADLAALPCSVDDPLESIAYGDKLVERVWIAGQPWPTSPAPS
jgi:cytosine/adenosine deaminase-related metal-dependent hydrolase